MAQRAAEASHGLGDEPEADPMDSLVADERLAVARELAGILRQRGAADSVVAACTSVRKSSLAFDAWGEWVLYSIEAYPHFCAVSVSPERSAQFSIWGGSAFILPHLGL